MSEQQVLPPKGLDGMDLHSMAVKIHTHYALHFLGMEYSERDGNSIHIDVIEHDFIGPALAPLLASLAQSEAERERLQHANDTLTGVIAIQVEKIAKLLLEDKSKPVVTNTEEEKA